MTVLQMKSRNSSIMRVLVLRILNINVNLDMCPRHDPKMTKVHQKLWETNLFVSTYPLPISICDAMLYAARLIQVKDMDLIMTICATYVP